MAQLIIQHWQELVQINDLRLVATKMVEKKVFEEYEIIQIFQTTDDRHNRRVFLFTLQEKIDFAFGAFLEALIETGHRSIADLLKPRRTIKAFRMPEGEDGSSIDQDDEPEGELTSSIETNASTKPIEIKLKFSEEFYDTPQQNGGLEYYSCRSKRRGRLLIINNYDFNDSHPYRNGAIVDEENLEKLFLQMGGWIVEKHSNTTTEQMRLILKDFTKYQKEKVSDVCIVCIMSHGGEILNETFIYGIDGTHISVPQVLNYFTNANCKLFKGKPKIFLFQVCRGNDLDISRPHVRTETDGTPKNSIQIPENPKLPDTSRLLNVRSVEDMLIGYATLQGYKAHRDPYRGTWYIELICRIFMDHAHNQPVDHLLMMVDQFLRRRLSEDKTVQTSEHKNRGFKKLYLNPGLYEENGVLKRF